MPCHPPHVHLTSAGARDLKIVKEFSKRWGGVGGCVERGWIQLKFQFSKKLEPKNVAAFFFMRGGGGGWGGVGGLKSNYHPFPVVITEIIICKLSGLWDICSLVISLIKL